MKYFICICCFLLSVTSCFSWGFYGHRLINRMAVFTLPAEMAGFYKQNITYLSDHAVDPDKRRYALTEEAPRHYIDLDKYSPEEYEILQQPWDSAVRYFSEDTLMAHGIVHWNIAGFYAKLKHAFMAGDFERALKLSADLGHYVGDVHVPLHTTSNYNGAFTKQDGIHALWESRVPELFAHGYSHWVGTAEYISNPRRAAWKAALSSHAALDTVFGAETEATKAVGEAEKYTVVNRGGREMRNYSLKYAQKYHELLSGQQERRMNLAIKLTGDLWYSAWVDAGKPALPGGAQIAVNDTEDAEPVHQPLHIRVHE